MLSNANIHRLLSKQTKINPITTRKQNHSELRRGQNEISFEQAHTQPINDACHTTHSDYSRLTEILDTASNHIRHSPSNGRANNYNTRFSKDCATYLVTRTNLTDNVVPEKVAAHQRFVTSATSTSSACDLQAPIRTQVRNDCDNHDDDAKWKPD